MPEKKNVDLVGSIWSRNPLFCMLLGLCPALAVTTTALGGVYMGALTTCVLMLTNLFVALLNHFVTEKGRVPVALAVSAILTTAAQMFIRAHIPAVSNALGIFLPLTAVNVLILNRAECCAAEKAPIAALNDGLVIGLGYTCALTGIGLVREFLGYGSLFGCKLLSGGNPVLIATMPAGGLMIVGAMMGIGNAIIKKLSRKKEGESA